MLASGLPVVASGVHGIVDYMKDGFNGYLADPEDSRDFAGKIRMLYDSETRKRIAANCSSSVEDFSMERSTEVLKEIFGDILETDIIVSEDRHAKR